MVVAGLEYNIAAIKKARINDLQNLVRSEECHGRATAKRIVCMNHGSMADSRCAIGQNRLVRQEIGTERRVGPEVPAHTAAGANPEKAQSTQTTKAKRRLGKIAEIIAEQQGPTARANRVWHCETRNHRIPLGLRVRQ